MLASYLTLPNYHQKKQKNVKINAKINIFWRILYSTEVIAKESETKLTASLLPLSPSKDSKRRST